MKKLFLFLSLAITLTSFSQRQPLPVEEKINLERRLFEEGQPFNQAVASSNQTFTGSILTKNLSGGYTVYPGWELVDAFGSVTVLPSNRDIFTYFNLGSGAATNYFPNQMVGANGALFGTLPFPITEGATFNTIAERISASDGDTAFWTRGDINGTLIYKGWNMYSNWVIDLEGDSITQSSAFTSGTDAALWQGMFRDFFFAHGFTPRIINKAKGGSNSNNWINLQVAGKLDFTAPVNIRFAMLGTNDVIQAYTANGNALTQPQIDALIATYIANVTKRLNYHITKYGNKIPFIVCAPTPIYNSVQEGALYQLRNALRNYITSISGGIWYGGSTPITEPANNIYFMSFGATDASSGLWTANDSTKYIEGTLGVHPNAGSSATMGTFIQNFLTVNTFVWN